MMSIEELTELYLEQKKSGNPESPETFAARYPEQYEELLSLLPALAAIEDMNDSTRPMGSSPTGFPHHLGDFCLHERIGSGGMGSVYRATQVSLNRDVALKILSPTLASDDEFRQRFANEAKIIATLHHQNIVNVYGAGYEQGWCFYVMELIDGRALTPDAFFGDAERLRKITEIAKQSADALAYAHGAHVLHRDFKLANLLMDQNGNVHLSDFGISSVLKDNAAIQVTSTQEGTLRYMAPEIFLEGTYSFASDQYGFGVSIYELITGQPCYVELTSGKLVREICDQRFPELTKSYSDLAIVINKCTSFHVADLYFSMSEVRDDLVRILNHEPIRAQKTPFLRKALLWMRRRPAVAALLIASSLLLIAFLTAIFIVKSSAHAITI